MTTARSTFRIAGAWLFCLLGTAPGATDFEAYRFTKRIDTSPVNREELGAVTLDTEVYTHTRDDLTDVRVRGSDGREVPCLVEKQRAKTSRFVDEQVRAETVSLQEREGNRIEVMMRVPGTPRDVDRLVFETPLRDYEKRITVSGSRDGLTWVELTRDQPIFDYSRYMDVRNTSVQLPPSDYRDYRVIIDNVTDVQSSAFVEFSRELRGTKPVSELGKTVIERRDFRIDRLTFWGRRRHEGATLDIEADRAVREFDATANPDEKRTEVLINTAREPLCGFTLQTPDRNFSRDVRIQIRRQTPGPREWTDVGTGGIRVLTFRNVRQSELTVRFTETRADEYRLLILDGDAPAITVTGVSGIGPVYRTLFLAYPGVSYDLYFGNPRAKAPSYDAERVLGPLKNANPDQLLSLSLAGMQENPAFGGPAGLAAALESKVLLGVVVAIVLAVLGWGIMSAMKGIDKIEEDGGEEPPAE